MVCRRSNKLSFPGSSGLCNNRYGSINSTFVQLLNIGYHPKFQQQLTTVTATDKRGFARKVAVLHLRTLVTVLTNNLWHSHKSRFQHLLQTFILSYPHFLLKICTCLCYFAIICRSTCKFFRVECVFISLAHFCSKFADLDEEPYILLGNGNTIQQISLDGNEGAPIINNTDYDIIGVDYDIRFVHTELPLLPTVYT